ncbi:MAG: FAD-linked oxidase C-terminal domain-containing protein, partial [Mesorhizobium sp.]
QLHLEEALAEALEKELVVDALISQSEQDRLNFWRLRDGCNDVLDRNCAPIVSLDLSLPVAAIPRFLAEAGKLSSPEAVAYAFGHLGDGNIHYIVSGARRHETVEPLFTLAAGMGGVISAEHGIGVDKSHYLRLCRSPEEIAAYRRLKAVFDPNGILNSGRIISDVPA